LPLYNIPTKAFPPLIRITQRIVRNGNKIDILCNVQFALHFLCNLNQLHQFSLSKIIKTTPSVP
jgi:hypothetical protein